LATHASQQFAQNMSDERPRRILIVDDEPAIRQAVARTLQDAQYVPHAVSDRAGALAALADNGFSLAILDVQLPDTDGFLLCEEIVNQWRLPVVMLTVLADESHAVRALESGADDYVRKPFSPRELTARVASVLRRVQREAGAQAVRVEAGRLQLDARSCRVQIGDETAALTPTEFRLLSHLVRYAGVVLAHDDVLESVWGVEYAGETHMLHVTVSRVRQKLARLDDRTIIRTVPGIGYELVIPR
jgi:DNA-binding response OmpR family regulator